MAIHTHTCKCGAVLSAGSADAINEAITAHEEEFHSDPVKKKLESQKEVLSYLAELPVGYVLTESDLEKILNAVID